MEDFEFLQNPISKKWIISAPKRAKRPDIAKGTEPVCPFCLGKEYNDIEVYRLGGVSGDDNWQIRVVKNKFPFAPIHEIVIHSPDHHKNFDELPMSQTILILETYRNRFKTHQDKGQVYIFHNRGEGGGESLPHPHSQIAVIPNDVKMEIPRLDPGSTVGMGPGALNRETKETGFEKQTVVESANFSLLCPHTSQWPDEVWILPKKRGRLFSEITDEEITDLSFVLQRLIWILNLRHGREFPFNFYIYPGGDWYLRLIPRQKSLGGFEIGTGVFVNTQDPKETISFIKEHFQNPDAEKIKTQNQASYRKNI